MLHTNDVTDLLKSKAGVMEVTKFTLAVERSGIENDMIMDVGTVCVSCYQKSVFSFGEAHSQLVANPIGFLRCDFTRFERLTNLVSNHIILLPSAGDMEILPLSQKKFLVCRHRITFIASDQFAFFRLFRILCIISPVTQTLCNGFPFVDMQCNQSCCRHNSPSSP